MLKWLNIFAIAYLAIAPGMDVGRLIHSVNLCRWADSAGHNAISDRPHQHCNHERSPTEPEPEEDDECPHMHQVAVHTAAMSVAQLQSVVAAALPTLNQPLLKMQAPLSACSAAQDSPRPPPGLPRVGITMLLV